MLGSREILKSLVVARAIGAFRISSRGLYMAFRGPQYVCHNIKTRVTSILYVCQSIEDLLTFTVRINDHEHTALMRSRLDVLLLSSSRSLS